MLFVGDDWAEDHHDVELMDEAGRTLAKVQLPEGVAGIARLHAMIAEQLGEDTDEAQVRIGIETDRGPWVAALLAAGYTVYAVNPLQASRYRDRHSVSGAKSDPADAHILADMVRTDAHQLRAIAGDSPETEAIKVVARAHKTLIWERTCHVLRLRHALREYFPAALEAFDDLDAPDTLELLGKAPDPASAAKLNRSQIRAALKHARRRDIDTKTTHIQAALRGEQLGRDAVITAAYAATTRSAVAVLITLDEQVKTLQGQVETHFGRHPDTEIILSQPGMGPILGARCSPNSVTRQDVTPTRERGRTTLQPARSPAGPARRSPCTQGSCTTTGSSTHSCRRPSPRCGPRPAPAPITTSNGPETSNTTPPCASSPTGSSASCMAA